MSQASIIINVSDQEHSHANGLSGIWTVPAKDKGEDFALLVVYPTPEIQDIGDLRKTVHWLKSAPLAMDIVGLRSDACAHTPGSPGNKEKWGLLLCEAQPDVSKDWLAAREEELNFLNDNPPDTKMRHDKKSGATVAINVESPEVTKTKLRLSYAVEHARLKFEGECRKLVTKAEITKAKQSLSREDARLVAEGDTMWAGNAASKENINEIHKRACVRTGQERPWCYVPQQLVDCPGCGAGIKENILSCPHCSGWLDEGIPALMKLTSKERAMKLYPDRYAEPVGATGVRK